MFKSSIEVKRYVPTIDRYLQDDTVERKSLPSTSKKKIKKTRKYK